MKKCTRCKETLSDEMFGSDKRLRSGLKSCCKLCISEKNSEYKRVNRELVIAQKRSHYREKRKEILFVHSKGDRQKNRTRHALFHAIRSGLIKKPGWCCICGVTGEKISGHHFDYSLPLSVIWCCARCHGIMHKKHYTGKEWSNG